MTIWELRQTVETYITVQDIAIFYALAILIALGLLRGRHL